MPPSARISSGGRASSISRVRHDSASTPAFSVSLPTSCRRSRSESSTIAESGFAGAASPTLIVRGRTSSANGPLEVRPVVISVSRPSAGPIAGWPAGYNDTARAAALQARANSASREAVSVSSVARASGIYVMIRKAILCAMLMARHPSPLTCTSADRSRPRPGRQPRQPPTHNRPGRRAPTCSPASTRRARRRPCPERLSPAA